MKKRRAETLMEILMAMMIFGIIMAGIGDFMADQTTNISRTITRDELIYGAQKLIANGIPSTLTADITATVGGSYPSTTIEYLEKKVVSFDWNSGTKTLTLKDPHRREKGRVPSMEIHLRPQNIIPPSSE